MSRGILMAAAMILALSAPLGAEQIKDITDIKGVRGNPLHGFGLVIGLNSTGDNAAASKQAMASYLRRLGIVLKPEDLTSKNIASVIVTAELGPWARLGSRIDVTVSAIGSASDLQGGELLMTELRGADGQVYAVAQGAISTGGFTATGDKASIVKNHPTVARLPGGARVEREELGHYVERGEATLLLRNADFATATGIAEAINKLHANSSYAVDPGTIRVKLPSTVNEKNVSGFLARIGKLEVDSEMPAVVIINERTGTIIVGANVGISKVAISHGNLSIVAEERESASQPLPFTRAGTTEKLRQTRLKTIEEKGTINVVNRTVTVSDMARALNAMGLTPRDLIAIFEALKQAGALQAELKTM
jgi:flagellar P-ring protein precursor FlgI